jgi:hypothetical protein
MFEFGNSVVFYAAAIWAMKKWYRTDKNVLRIVSELLDDLYKEAGWKTQVLAPLIGSIVYLFMKKEDKRLASGWTYEPQTAYRKNAKAEALLNQ